MPRRNNNDPVNLAPAQQPGADYERDFYSWSLEQARLIREGRWDGIDRDNVAEEIASLGREQFNKLESALRIVMLHVLKWDYQPAMRSRSWMLSIETQRLEIEDVREDNPGLKPRIPEAIRRAYRKARLEAARETGQEKDAFPPVCPYELADLTERAFKL